MATYTLKEWCEEEIPFALKRDPTGSGVLIVYNLTGATDIRFWRYNTKTETRDFLSTVTTPTRMQVVSAAAGTVKIIPAATYWALGEYRCWIEVTMSGKKYLFPSDDAHIFVIEHKYD